MGTVRQYKFSETGKWGKSTNQMDPGKQTMENIEKTTGIRPTYRSQPIRNESGQNKNDRQNEKGRNSTYMYRRILDLTYFNSTPIYQKHPILERI